MNPMKKELHEIKSWATVRQTSLEIAEAIFELANYDEVVAEQIWQEGSDEVLPLAFSKTNADQLFWGEQTIERKNV
ncbi:YccJ family protein [Orbus sasakiae]|uniref:YccJ family protein n=1 Tax=Orbus sasakiae TaxID=1078475 RepID=A0ABP9N4Y3_9GAMM